ncbi:hypothetical protein B0T25DRAFT_78318 [Lasiosphaeria hispida]|uniref:M protein, serotype 2.1 n=1 Tax=Lasiosphaeria hispida TaxID=260671 RepID=A0AAJ0HPC2_9PEZI|nr:hypothetical protein B0T25DRAFT_78318 [Lasiosphaeria hispida]
MAAVVKKPPASGRETPTGTPSRPTPRATTPSSAAATATGGVTRARSVRTGNPVSARAAVSQRRESLLSNGTSSITSGPSQTDVEREEAIRAETVALLDDLKERLSKAETASESYKRQTEVLQDKLDEALAEQAKLEEKVHESEEQIESLANEKREAARQMREMESIYEAERSAMMKEKDEMANREEQMQTVIQRLKDSLAQRNMDDDRPTRQLATNSPSIDSGSFAPPNSLSRSDSRNNSKLVLQKDKLIESLRLELAEAHIKLVETENQGGGRLHEVERLLMEARMANARLMEDNESYQLLLQDKTLKGDFGTSDFSYMGVAAANQDALAALEGRSSGTSLADELSEAAGNDHPQESESETQRRLEGELKTVKDQNKALTLYINKIIERLLQHQDFEHILDQSSDFKSVPNTNKDLPPPPGRNAASSPSLLQRAKSIAIGGGPATKPRPRPMSFMPSAGNSNAASSGAGPSALNNPETAPSIPIGLSRNTSTRRGRPMSEQYTGGAGAASIINAMYKGTSEGPLSPTLRSSQTFFLPQGAGNRASSSGPGGHGSSSNIATPPLSMSGNFPGMKSETSSTSGDSITGGYGGTGDITTPPSQSPPRHHEKSTTFAGNKPRPLRLVQENSDQSGANNANKRQSWIGWASSAFAVKKEDGSSQESGGAREVIRE